MLSRRHFFLTLPVTALGHAAAKDKNIVACQTNAWEFNPQEFSELLAVLERIKRFGYQAFETNVRNVQNQFQNAKQARAQIEKTGLRFYGPDCNLGQNMEGFQKTTDGAAALGASRIVINPGGPYGSGKLDEESLRKKSEALNAFGKVCKGKGLRLVYHNHNLEFQGNGAESEELLRRTDPELVGLLLDQGHAYDAGADVNAFFKRHHARIDAIHLRDLKAGKQVPLGQGKYDFKTLAAIITETRWPGWLETEDELRTKDFNLADQAVQSDRQFIKKMFGA